MDEDCKDLLQEAKEQLEKHADSSRLFHAARVTMSAPLRLVKMPPLKKGWESILPPGQSPFGLEQKKCPNGDLRQSCYFGEEAAWIEYRRLIRVASMLVHGSSTPRNGRFGKPGPKVKVEQWTLSLYEEALRDPPTFEIRGFDDEQLGRWGVEKRELLDRIPGRAVWQRRYWTSEEVIDAVLFPKPRSKVEQPSGYMEVSITANLFSASARIVDRKLGEPSKSLSAPFLGTGPGNCDPVSVEGPHVEVGLFTYAGVEVVVSAGDQQLLQAMIKSRWGLIAQSYESEAGVERKNLRSKISQLRTLLNEAFGNESGLKPILSTGRGNTLKYHLNLEALRQAGEARRKGI